MPAYLVETYLARDGAGERSRPRVAGKHGREALTTGTSHIRFERSIYVPEDEICFFIFDAPSDRDAPQPSEAEPIRVVEAVISSVNSRLEEER